MKKNIEESSDFDVYAKVNEESALKEEQKKAEEAYRADFQNREKTSRNEKNDWKKLRENDDAKKEKRVAEFKKEEEKRQEKKDFVKSYKRQLGEAEDNIDNASIDSKKTVVNKIDATVDNAPINNAPVDNETDLQKIIRERNENMPDKIGDESLNNDLKERAAEILATGEQDAETQRKMINKQDKRIDDLSVENEQLEKFFEIADKRLDAMKDELNRQIEEVKNPTLKESIIGFLKKPKVKGAIIFGLAGAAVYAASGGTAVPVYFVVKAALAKAGISIFVPAATGHGLSTWGAAAAAGGATGEFASYLSKKLGLSKGEKSDKEKHQEGLENLKNIASGQQVNTVRQEGQSQSNEASGGNSAEKSTDSKNEELDVEKIVNFIKEAKENKMTAQELLNESNGDIELINKTLETIKSKMSILAFTKEKRDINAAHKWLREKLEEIKKHEKAFKENTEQQPPETAVESEKKENEQEYAEWLIFKFKEKIADGIEKFNTGKLDGEGVFKFAEEVREMLNSPAADKVKGARSGYVDALRNIDPETQAKMVNSMVEFAISQKMDNDEIRDLARILIWKTEEEYKNFKGIDEKNMEWLTTGKKGVEEKEIEEEKKIKKEIELQIEKAMKKMNKGDKKKYRKIFEDEKDYISHHNTIFAILSDETYGEVFGKLGLKYEEIKKIDAKWLISTIENKLNYK